MPSSTSSFERPIPAMPWRGMALAATLLTLVAAVAWEVASRRAGYEPTLNDTSDLWAQRRSAVRPDSTVIIGDSRALFDLDLDEMEKGLGARPVQLGLVGSCAYPVLDHLASDPAFRGTVVCSLVPAMFLVPAGPPLENSYRAIRRYENWTWAQRSGHHLGMFLEERVAFMKQDDLTLAALLKRLPIANRPGARVGPRLPPYFSTLDRERRTLMWGAAASPGPLQDRVKFGWIPLFTPPPPPPYVPQEAFLNFIHTAIEKRFKDAVVAVEKIRSRGGKVVFVRLPVTGPLKELEDKATPRAGPWTRLLQETRAPGIYFEDYPELNAFTCPEWSHLSGPDSIEFTRRLIPHLKTALAQ